MLSKIEKIFMILLIILAIWNLYSVYNCYDWCHDEHIGKGGLGSPRFNTGTGLIVVMIQITNIVLLSLILKEKKNKKKLNILFISVLLLFAVSYFIPIWGFQYAQKHLNLYGKETSIVYIIKQFSFNK